MKDRSNGLTPAGLGWVNLLDTHAELRWPGTIEMGQLRIKFGRTSVQLRAGGVFVKDASPKRSRSAS
jgi:hypothetical protein